LGVCACVSLPPRPPAPPPPPPAPPGVLQSPLPALPRAALRVAPCPPRAGPGRAGHACCRPTGLVLPRADLTSRSCLLTPPSLPARHRPCVHPSRSRAVHRSPDFHSAPGRTGVCGVRVRRPPLISCVPVPHPTTRTHTRSSRAERARCCTVFGGLRRRFSTPTRCVLVTRMCPPPCPLKG
jgi:hypothetical protein